MIYCINNIFINVLIMIIIIIVTTIIISLKYMHFMYIGNNLILNIKELFRTVNNLVGSNTHNPLPPGKMTEEIAEGFANFSNKMTKI